MASQVSPTTQYDADNALGVKQTVCMQCADRLVGFRYVRYL